MRLVSDVRLPDRLGQRGSERHRASWWAELLSQLDPGGGCRGGVFISHAAADLWEAERFRAAFLSLGVRAYVAVLDNRGGEDWKQRIAVEMGRADAYLGLMSPEAAVSEAVQEEFRLALAQECRRPGRFTVGLIEVRAFDKRLLPPDMRRRHIA